MLETFGLTPAIGWYVRGFSERSGLPVKLDMPRQLARLPQNMETTIFRILQEALTNVHRHSRAKRVTVRLRRQLSGIMLDVRDNGKGMPPKIAAALRRESAEGLGVGIPGMRERAKLLGGQLTIASTRRGTTVTAILPLSKDVTKVLSHSDRG